MEDEKTQSTQPDYAEAIKNLKAEQDRKLSNIEQSIQNSLANLPHLIQQQVSSMAPRVPEQSASAVDPYEDPQGYQQQLLEQVAKIVDNKVNGAIQHYEQSTVEKSQLYTEFPELTDQSHPMTQAVIQRYQSLSPEQRKDGDQHLKSIVYQVASERGIRPKQYRDSGSEDFSLSSKSGESTVAPKKEPSKHEGVDEKSVIWAELLKKAGAPININKEKDMAKLKEFSQRKDWTTIAGSPEFTRGGKNDE